MFNYDVSTIIFKYTKNLFINYHLNHKKYCSLSYMSDNSIFCNFKINNKNIKNGHSKSTINIYTIYFRNI